MSADVELAKEGLRLRRHPLWMDGRKKQPLCVVTHAHADHAARHHRTIATPETLALLADRVGLPGEAIPVELGGHVELEGLRIELLSAGHILGSAQARVTLPDGRRVTYTGDLNDAGARTAAKLQVAHCDVLVIEATYGDPRYRFPPREAALAALTQFVEVTQATGDVPVVLGYPLGKSQEALLHLGEQGFRLAAHASIHDVCMRYRALGVALPEVRRFEGSLEPGEVLLFPPNLRRSGALEGLGRVRTAVLSGWALDGARRDRAMGDVAIPLSDHADFGGLVAYAKATGAKQLFTMHGQVEALAAALRAEGLDARPLTAAPPQLALF